MIAPPELDAHTARAWLASGQPCVLVTVLSAKGSVPRAAGTRMLVSTNDLAGSVGGGHLELQALAQARALLEADDALADPLIWSVSLGPSLGQCCGGALQLRFSRLTESALSDWPRPTPRFRLQLYGAGHVGRALVQACLALPCELRWLDERPDMFPALPLPAHMQCLASPNLVDEVADAQAGDHHLVMTHSHALDLELVQAILRRQDAAWIGLIGSASKRARFAHRLRDRGFSPAEVAQVHCPVGLPSVVGKEPGVIAISVLVDLLSSRVG